MKAAAYLVGVGFLISWSVAIAQTGGEPGPVSGEQGPIPEDVQPDVTIVEGEDAVVFEYRVRGQLYMVKVVPMSGPSYYLLDTDGNGVIDVQDRRTPDLTVPQWLLFSW
jgi:hypothetical protein